MPNYQDGKIYKITAGNFIYYGSTTQPLSKRLAEHRYTKKYKPNSNFSSFPLLDMPDCKIVLVEDYPCERREQLLAREAYYIRFFICVNNSIPYLDEITKDNNRHELYKYHKQLRSIKHNLEQEPTPKPEPGQSYSSRYKEKQKRLNLIKQGKITFTS
jgi:hypothetical protein